MWLKPFFSRSPLSAAQGESSIDRLNSGKYRFDPKEDYDYTNYHSHSHTNYAHPASCTLEQHDDGRAGPCLANGSQVFHAHAAPAKLVRVVREDTRQFIDVNAATAAGYNPFLGCVSGPDHGAMGVHYINPLCTVTER